ncbi:MAG: methyltransferase [Bacteroides sp.]|nr:methyltransferase [Bacteroides sp.]
MPKSFFQFKHFTVWHDRCAMKVGTDGVLLGAWVPQGNYRRILDVGTGTGLIALMLAQRMPEAKIVGVEIDAAASEQARENVSRTEWADRIEIECCDFRNYQSDETFNLIVSNPPYFIDALKCPAEQRSVARHAGSMNYDLLFRRSASLLHPDGQICIIIPSEIEKNVTDAAWNHHLYPCRRLRVYTKPGKPCRRVLLAFSFKESICAEDALCIESEAQQYTAEYIALTRDFYLKM